MEQQGCFLQVAPACAQGGRTSSFHLLRPQGQRLPRRELSSAEEEAVGRIKVEESFFYQCCVCDGGEGRNSGS